MTEKDNSDDENLRDKKTTNQPPGPVTPESTVQELIQAGMPEADARTIVRAMVEEKRREKANLAKAIEKAENQQEYASIAAGITIAVGVFASLSDSMVGYVLATVVAAVAGYFMNPAKAWAGIIGFVSGTIVFMVASHYYFLNRKSFINLEMIIPLIPGIITAWLIRNLIEAVAYYDEDDD